MGAVGQGTAKPPSRALLTEGPEGPLLARLTVPMIGGIFAISAFQLADTYFVSLLGTRQLAAMSFTFPVVMTVASVAMGLGLGASSTISRAIGAGDAHRIRRLATDSLLLAFCIVAVVATVGLFTMDPLFRAMGAEEDVLPLIKDYMRIWYVSVAVLVVPMVGNNAIRATGDTFTPGMIMSLSAATNVVLDPLFIFGLGPFPAMGIAGAALATALSRATTLVAALWILTVRCRLIDWARPAVAEVLASWREILHVGLPAAATHLLEPVSRGVVVRMVAAYGTWAVAGVGAASRVEMLSFVVPRALGAILIPFSGQNWGARRTDRVARGWRLANGFGAGWSLASLVLVTLVGSWLASLFTTEAAVAQTFVTYLLIAFCGGVLLHAAMYANLILNAIGHPFSAALLSGTRLFVFTIPLAYGGGRLWGLKGIFVGVAVSNVLSAVAGMAWVGRVLRLEGASAAAPPDTSTSAGADEVP